MRKAGIATILFDPRGDVGSKVISDLSLFFAMFVDKIDVPLPTLIHYNRLVKLDGRLATSTFRIF
jgi:hypothetical protein